MVSAVESPFLIKPGQRANTLGWQELELVFAHPAHIKNFAVIRDLITLLRQCRTPAEYGNFQKHLFQAAYAAHTRRGEAARAIKRLKRGKSADASAPPQGPVIGELESWRLEEFVFERIGRQLRSVGDALAWQAFGYDRRMILTLSRNSPVGSMYLKTGLDYELGRIEDIWSRTGHFAILHDLTNCLRMGDITEFADGGALLHEVKTNPDKKNKVQTERMQKAIDAIMHGGKLPGHLPDAKLILLKTSFKSDLRKLQDAINLAKGRGFQGIRLSEGRALMAFSLPKTFELYKGHPKDAVAKFETERSAAIKRAGIDRATHHALGGSSDKASRSPVSVPWAIYPLSIDDCAALTCDLLSFETVLSIDALSDELRKEGFSTTILLPEERGRQMSEDQDVIRAQYGADGLTIHGGGISPLLYELMLPSTLAQGMRELITSSAAPHSPVAIFSGDDQVWWQPEGEFRPNGASL